MEPRRHLPPPLLAVLLSVALVSLLAVGASQGEEPSIPITQEQAGRGAALYAQHCAACHGEELEGFGPFPVLRGDTFHQRWRGKSLADLYRYVHDLMPLGQGGSLEDAAYAEIVALLLRRNGLQPGETTFSPEDEEAMALPLPF